MPQLPYVTNGVQVSIIHEQSLQAALCTFHALGFSGFNQADLDQLADYVGERWKIRLMPQMSFKCALLQVEARGIRQNGDFVGLWTSGAPYEGLITNESERPQEATCIKVTTGLTGAGYRGRMFIPGLPNNVVDEGEISSVYRFATAAGLRLFFEDIKNNTEFQPVVVSYVYNKVVRAVPVTTPIRSTDTVTKTPSVLPSRKPGKGI